MCYCIDAGALQFVCLNCTTVPGEEPKVTGRCTDCNAEVYDQNKRCYMCCLELWWPTLGPLPEATRTLAPTGRETGDFVGEAGISAG